MEQQLGPDEPLCNEKWKDIIWKDVPGVPDVEQLLGSDHPQRTRPHHLPHLLQQQVQQEFLKIEVDK